MYKASSGRSNRVASLTLGGVIVLILFSLLPLLQGITSWAQGKKIHEIKNVAEQLPDRIEKPPEKEPEEKVIDKPDDIEEPLKPIDLTMLDKLINLPNDGVGIDTGFTGKLFNGIEDIVPFDLKDLDKVPKVLVAVKPMSPYAMKGQKGRVLVEFVIAPDGSVTRPRVVNSTNRAFEPAALEAVRRSKWDPGYKEGEAVHSRVRITIEFVQ